MTTPKTPSLAPVITLLEQAYEAAIDLFPEEDQREALRDKRPLIVIQTHGSRSSVYGWHAPNMWKDGRKKLDEITLTAETLGRGLYEVMDTLVHEMVHHVNGLFGVDDVSANGYHNKKFKTLAEGVLLRVERSSKGYAHTHPTDAFRDAVKGWDLRNTEVLDVYRVIPPKEEKPGSKLKKWACDCGYGIRIAVNSDRVNLTCGICGEQVEIQE